MPDISYRCFRQADEDVKFAATLAHVEELEQDGYVCKLYFDRRAIEIPPYDPLIIPPESFMTDFTYEVNDSTVTLNAGRETTYSWNFGDGSTSEEKNPKHSYASGGRYNVTLTTSFADGTEEVTAKQVDIAVSDTLVEGWNTLTPEDIFYESNTGGLKANFPITAVGVQVEAYANLDDFNLPAGLSITKVRISLQAKSINNLGTARQAYSYVEIEDAVSDEIVFDRNYYIADNDYNYIVREYNLFTPLSYLEVAAEVFGSDADMTHTIDVKTLEVYLEAI